MEATTVEVLSMLGTWFSGGGAFSAIIYAINTNRPKIKGKASCIEAGDEGNFTLDILNTKPILANISHVRLVEHSFLGVKKNNPSEYSRSSIIKNRPQRQCERLDLEIKPYSVIKLELSVKHILDAYCELCDIKEPIGMQRMKKARIAVFLYSGGVYYIDLPKSMYQSMKNVMLMQARRRINELETKGLKVCAEVNNWNGSLCELGAWALKEYEFALRRHYYLDLPYGIKEKHFRSNS
ncbi:hypothetical protein [Vibrio sp. MED222]|uniref:hypothetical protein n=1 Tax=Vibrio sp. MED222 TaxID=314290 RepID=UPI000068E566|nr:hypothetical protein [Vibrio sp. MED222]EAQ54279.1 hypothetical protein MED222_14315 [Vibrio sp. MED222]